MSNNNFILLSKFTNSILRNTGIKYDCHFSF